MRKAFQTATVCVAAVSMTGCFGRMDIEEDAGPQAKKEFNLTGYDSISAAGSMDVTVTVGEGASINVSGSQSRIENFTAEVKDGELVLDEESSGLFGHSSGDLHVTITVPELKAYSVSGSGESVIKGVKSSKLDLSVSGSGSIEVEGEADECAITVTGSGEVFAKALKTKQATATVTGSGDIEVFGSESVKAAITGSGDITTFGEGKVTESITGSGDVSKG